MTYNIESSLSPITYNPYKYQRTNSGEKRVVNPNLLPSITVPSTSLSENLFPNIAWNNKKLELHNKISMPLAQENTFEKKLQTLKGIFIPHPLNLYQFSVSLDDPKNASIKMELNDLQDSYEFTVFESIETEGAQKDVKLLSYYLHLEDASIIETDRNTGVFIIDDYVEDLSKLTMEMFSLNAPVSTEYKTQRVAAEPLINQFFSEDVIPESPRDSIESTSELSESSTDEDFELKNEESKNFNIDIFEKEFGSSYKSASNLKEKIDAILKHFTETSADIFEVLLCFPDPECKINLMVNIKNENFIIKAYSVEEDEGQGVLLISFKLGIDDRISDIKIKIAGDFTEDKCVAILKIIGQMFSPHEIPHLHDVSLFNKSISKVDFDKFLTSIKNIGSYSDQIQAIQKYFILIKPGKHAIYVRWDEKKDINLKFVLTTSKYKPAKVKKIFILPNKKEQFYIFNVYEKTIKSGIQYELMILKNKMSESITELSWIQKGDKLSGNEVLKSIFNVIPETIKLKSVILFDDAKKNKEYQTLIRIADSLTGDNPLGPSWYERAAGFEPLRCENVKMVWSTKITQDPDKYVEAKKLMRNTTIDDMSDFLSINPTTQMQVIQLKQKYLESTIQTPTIHDLAKAISLKARSAASENERKIAEEDLDKFLHFTVKSPWKIKKAEGKLKDFLEALKIIENTRIFVKKYR